MQIIFDFLCKYYEKGRAAALPRQTGRPSDNPPFGKR